MRTITSAQDRTDRTTIVGVWDTQSCKKLREFKIPRRLGEQARLSLDGKVVATSKRGEMLCIWDAQSGKRFLESTGHDEQVTRVAFTPDGSKLVTAGPETRVWDTATSKQLATFPAGLKTSILLPNSREFFLDWGGFRRMDLVSGKQVEGLFAPPSLAGQLPGDVFRATAYSLTARGKSVTAYGFLNGPNRRTTNPYQVTWDLATGQPVSEAELPAIASIDALSANGRVAIHTNTTTRPAAGDVAKAGFPTEYSTDAQAIDVITGRILAEIRIPETPSFHQVVAADGHSFATVSGKRGPYPAHPPANLDVRIWEIRSGRERAVIPLKSPGHYDPCTLVFSADGRMVAVSRISTQIEIFDTATGREMIAFSGFESRSYKLAFSSDGRRLASGHTDGTSLVWDVPAVPQLPAIDLTEAWNDLATNDPIRANVASWRLVNSPGAVGYLNERLTSADGKVANRIRALISDLESKSFQVREAASRDLAAVAENAEGILRDALREQLTEEQRTRIQRVLESPGIIHSADLLRQLRGIETLQRMGTKEAEDVLRRLADGSQQFRTSREARIAIENPR